MAWISKIVGHGKEDPEQLLANPANFRTHTLFQRRVLEGAIDEIGFIRSVIVNVTTGHVIDGHERIRLAMERNEPFIDVEYVELTPEEELKALTTLDPIAALAGTDRPKLAETMAFANIKNDALTKLCGILAAQNGLDKTLPTPPRSCRAKRTTTIPRPSGSIVLRPRNLHRIYPIGRCGCQALPVDQSDRYRHGNATLCSPSI